MKDEEFCIGPGRDGESCQRPTFRGAFCQGHVKQQQRGGRLEPLTEKLTPKQRAIEAGIAMLECEGDDAEHTRLENAWVAACKVLGKGDRGESISEALRRARARGVRIGRPPKTPIEELQRIYAATGSVSMTARVLQMSKSSVHERLFGKSDFPNDRPRKTG